MRECEQKLPYICQRYTIQFSGIMRQQKKKAFQTAKLLLQTKQEKPKKKKNLHIKRQLNKEQPEDKT